MTLPKENLDNKAFSDLLKEAISRIPVYAPEWTDHNIHDPGITFIELFAWLTEMQIYRLNRINDKSYRKFLKLMGIPKLRSARAARVDVTFSLSPDVAQVEVPACTIVAATDPVTGEDILFETLFETKQKLDLENKELTVPAVHAIKRNAKFSSNGLPNFYIDLKYAPVLDETGSKINLTVNSDEQWEEVEDFDASNPGDKHYTVDLASGRVAFGNGINGKIPPKGIDNTKVCYYSGGGTRGNVNPGAITRIISNDKNENLLGKVTITNKKAASGGTDAETLGEAIQRIRKEMKEVTRAVKSEDYEYLVLNTPGVQVARARALPRYHPRKKDREVPGIISVVVVPIRTSDEPMPIPDQSLLKAVYKHLEKYRMLTTELFVLPPKYEKVYVEATIKVMPKRVKPKDSQDKIEKDVKKRLEEFLDPLSGGFDHKGWPFGRSVYRSEIYQVIDAVEGVDYVTSVILYKVNFSNSDIIKIKQEGDMDILAHSLVSLVDAKISAVEEI